MNRRAIFFRPAGLTWWRHCPSALIASLRLSSLLVLLLGLVSLSLARAADAPPKSLTREQVIAQTMVPYAGPTDKGVDRSTLTGKIMSGYQGWFAAEGDGCGRGWYHWNGRNGFKPGSCKIDLWPDVSELDADERYATSFKLSDGRGSLQRFQPEDRPASFQMDARLRPGRRIRATIRG